MALASTLLTCAAVFVGALTQRMTGLGFALVAAPLLVVVAGPVQGVLLGNVLSAMLCVIVLASVWRQIWWRRALLMIAPALVTVPIGAWVTRRVPTPLLLIVVGAVALVAVLMAAASSRVRLLPGRIGAVVGGGLSGFMNATAGVGGPMLAAHALSDRWPRDTFVATGQLFLLVLNLLSITTKGVPHVSLVVWAGVLIALALGAACGHVLGPKVPAGAGRRLVLILAAIGSAAAVVRGVLALHG
ncbi:MAG TPA: sulfite exporter TauE/SafE family protein [Gryllotalpicola sp.]